MHFKFGETQHLQIFVMLLMCKTSELKLRKYLKGNMHHKNDKGSKEPEYIPD